MDQDKRLSGKTILILVASGFEEQEMTDTQKALIAAGATTKLVSSELGLANGWHEGTWGHNFYIEAKVNDILPSQFDGLLVPGGARSIATLMENAHARRIVKGMVDAEKPVGAFGEALDLFVAGESIGGRTLTGAEALRAKAEALGAIWSEEQPVVDKHLITSADGSNIDAFIDAFLDVIEQADGGELVAA